MTLHTLTGWAATCPRFERRAAWVIMESAIAARRRGNGARGAPRAQFTARPRTAHRVEAWLTAC